MKFTTRWSSVGWVRHVANKGLRYKDAAYGPFPILDAMGRPVTTPQYLTANGQDVVDTNDPEAMVNTIDIDVYEELDIGPYLQFEIDGT